MLGSSLGYSSCVLVPEHNCENCMSICLPYCLSVCLSLRLLQHMPWGTVTSSAPAVLALCAVAAWHNCNNPIRLLFSAFLPLSFFLFLCRSRRLAVPLWLHSVNTAANCYYSCIIVFCDCERFSINTLFNNKHNYQLAFSLQMFWVF